MRRFLFGVVIASVTAAMPVLAFGGDREIAQSVMAELQQHKAAGELKGFDIDLKVEDGVVFLTGEVASQEQRELVEQAVIKEVGRQNLVNDLRVKSSKPAALPLAIPKTVVPVSVPMPIAESNSDIDVTDAVIAKLQQSKSSGELRGFDLDVSTTNGDVWLQGTVANQDQKSLVLDLARRTAGVSRVIDDVIVQGTSPIRQVSTGAPAPMPQASSMPVVGQPMPVQPMPAQPMVAQPMVAQPMMQNGGPQAFAPSGLASYNNGGYVQGGYSQGGPVPMQGAGAEYGVGAPRYDQPNMPSYAWPSYAAHPNYAAVTYPKQYSPSAWPYIGPFYPYPQVPLGWRKVALEWDDGLWYLDFTSK